MMRRLCSITCTSIGIGAALLLITQMACHETQGPVIEGTDYTLQMNIALQDLTTTERNSIGSFSVELGINNQFKTYSLNFTSPNTFAWIPGDEPPKTLPTSGTLEIRLSARDNNNTVLSPSIIGTSDIVTFDATSGTTPPITIIVGRANTFTPMAIRGTKTTLNQARALHTASAVGTGVLIVGGAIGNPANPSLVTSPVAEWYDPGTGLACQSDTNTTCQWGTKPPGRIKHIALDLSRGFASTCPLKDNILITMGQGDPSGTTALKDVFLFDPNRFGDATTGAFIEVTGLTSLTARIDAVAYATNSCQVHLVGGHDGAPAPTIVTTTDIIDFSQAIISGTTVTGVTATTSTSTPSAPPVGATAFQLDNAGKDVMIAGGENPIGTATNVAYAVEHTGAAPAFCDLTNNTPQNCNGTGSSNQALTCARSNPKSARLMGIGGIISPTLIMGGSSTSCNTNNTNVELFLSSTSVPFNSFINITNAPITVRTMGHTLTSLSDGSVLIVGGLDSTGNIVLDQVEIFSLPQGLSEGATSVTGSFTARTPLTAKSAYHGMSNHGTFVMRTGGWDGANVTNTIEVYIPTP